MAMRKQTHVNNWVVSTVELSVDHGHGGRPIYHETYIFEADASGKITNWSEVWGERYYSEDEALDKHPKLVAKIEAGWVPSYGNDDEETE
jgi:hypothetical protein